MANTPDRELEIFGAVWLKPDHERAAFLDEACADDAALRQRVAQLLHASQQAGDFLTRPAGGAPGPDGAIHSPEMPTPNPGDQVGPYRLGQPIGEGGCGVVYLAEQEIPVRRQVALKVIKLGMDTKNVIARFEAERHVLALMDHPNIARVLDAGTTTTGRPYFVMELVRGIKITDYCDQNNLSTRERLDLFMRVCRAVQHAHQKGIIHRDLKPSNILVTVHDGVPMPKVIDFGIAKATLGKLTDLTVFTAFEQFIGTPAYMSPEQAEPGAVDIDTRSDIYSLGVLLYELLTGQTPFETEELMKQGVDTMRKTIREKEPVRPSTKLSQTLVAADVRRLKSLSADTPGTEEEIRASARRLLRVKEMIALVRGDLDWIVMKSLEKDRSRRYETATGFAADIQRHIDNEPVIARPPSRLYAFQKMVRRHRLAFAAGTIVVLALILALGAATVALVLIQRAKDNATAALVLVKQAKDDAIEKLRSSYLAEARATRLSGQSGGRFVSLETAQKAAAIRPDLAVRNEVIACLAVSDLAVAREKIITGHAQNEKACFDLALQRYAFGDTNGNIIIRSAASDAVLAVLPAPGFTVEQIGAFSLDGKYLTARYSSRREGDSDWVWNWESRQVLVHLNRHPNAANLSSIYVATDFSPDSRFFFSSHADGNISVYELPSGRKTKRLASPRPCFHLLADPGDKRLAGCSLNNPRVDIRDLASGQTLSTVTVPAGVSALAWSADGQRLATAGRDFNIYIWEAATGRQLAVLNGHSSFITSIAFDHTGDLLASASYDGVLRLWNSFSGRELARHHGSSRQLQFSADDASLQGWQDVSHYGVLAVGASRECRLLYAPGPHFFVSVPAFSADGRILAVASDNQVCLWDAGSGREIGSFPLPGGDALIFPPNGRSLITIDRLKGICQRTWQPPGGPSSSTWRLGPPRQLVDAAMIEDASLSQDGRHLAVTQQTTGKAFIFDLPAPATKVVLAGHPEVSHVALSPDGHWAATGAWYNPLVKIWDARSGSLVRTLSEPARTSVCFSPDGQWLATSSSEYQLRAVGSWTPKDAPQSTCEDGATSFTAFSPNGQVMARTETDKIQLLETASGKLLATLESPGSSTATKCQFSPDGTKLAAIQIDQQLRLWDLRLIRAELAPMHLDWDLPPYPLVASVPSGSPATLEIGSDTNTAAP